MRILENTAYGDVTSLDEVESQSLIKYGKYSLSFSELTSDVVPQLLAGSWIYIETVLYTFSANETLVDNSIDGTVYVRIKGFENATIEITSETLPSWDESRKGYYDDDNFIYVMSMTKSGTSFTNKLLLGEYYNNITNYVNAYTMKATNSTIENLDTNTLTVDPQGWSKKIIEVYSNWANTTQTVPSSQWYVGDGLYLVIWNYDTAVAYGGGWQGLVHVKKDTVNNQSNHGSSADTNQFSYSGNNDWMVAGTSAISIKKIYLVDLGGAY